MRLTCHLGLVCPEGARVRVGPTWGTWQEGKCIFFDDSYEHEAGRTRVSWRCPGDLPPESSFGTRCEVMLSDIVYTCLRLEM